MNLRYAISIMVLSLWALTVPCGSSASAQEAQKTEGKAAKSTKQGTKSSGTKTANKQQDKTSEGSNADKGKAAKAEEPPKAKQGESADGAKSESAGGAKKTGASGSAKTASKDAAKDAATYVVRLRDLESKVDELKEQIRRSHTRLSLLSESVLSTGVGGAEAEIVFRNSMSNAFRVTGVLVVLDGAVQYNENGEEAPHRRQKVTPIFKGAVPPGDHTIQIVVKLQGHGYGVFSYLRGYKFEARSTHSFTVRQGQGVQIEAIAWEKGTVTTALDQRPAVRFVEQPLDSIEEEAISED